jgi:peptidoglycan/xylan/chitin deacetylase (PgdA/CDA1 family)
LGSHTISHPVLTSLDDPSALDEIQNSRIHLQDRLEMQIDFFSYPYSRSNARIQGLVELAGYKAACAVDSGSWSLFNLWRVQCLRDDTALTFALKASGWYTRLFALRESVVGRNLRLQIRKFKQRINKPKLTSP